MVSLPSKSDAGFQLIDLSGTTPGSHKAAHNGSSCSSQLVQAIRQGLMHPSVPLSAAAAAKLELQQEQLQKDGAQPSPSKPGWRGASSAAHDHEQYPDDGCSSGCSGSNGTTTCHCSNCQSLGPSNGTDSSSICSTSIAGSSSAPVLLKSLPVELLYDDTGLALFDSITHLPEYYLTAAEADILARCGRDIAERCVPGHAAVLVELGAGSMRKTKLLLQAVLSCERQGVSFCALDLCEASLKEALQQLQDEFHGDIHLTGLVGTYEQGLAYIQANTIQQHGQGQDATAGKRSISTAAAGKQDCQGLRDIAPAGAADLASEGGSDSDDGSWPAVFSCYELQTESLTPCSGNSSDGSSSSLSTVKTAASFDPCSGPDALKAAAAAGGLQERPPKVIMWLGSSIGNYGRDEAAAFLKQLREVAMLPGDALLVGIDRRNSPSKVAAAYNDPAGITRDFILNGLHHAKHLLDQQLKLNSSSSRCSNDGNNLLPVSSNSSATFGKTSSYGCDGPSSLDPAAFEYFCLYNAELGRHEAYYQAIRDTQVMLPTASIADIVGRAAVAAPAGVAVPVAAGELIHIEFSYKYSRDEVQALTDAAGLVWSTAWTDSQQQYDLHLLRLPTLE